MDSAAFRCPSSHILAVGGLDAVILVIGTDVSGKAAEQTFLLHSGHILVLSVGSESESAGVGIHTLTHKFLLALLATDGIPEVSFVVAATDVGQHFGIILHNVFLLLVIVGETQTEHIAVVSHILAVHLELGSSTVTANVRFRVDVQRNILLRVHGDFAVLVNMLFNVFLDVFHPRYLHNV